MNQDEKLSKVLGVTEFALYRKESLPDIISYEYYEKYVQGISKQVNDPKLIGHALVRSMNFKYVSGFELNGKSFIDDESDYIWLEEGVIIKTYNIFSEMLIHNTFPEYFSGDVEIANMHLRLTDSEGIMEFETTYRTALEENRKIIAEYLSMFATKFVILHEMAHHYNGHLLYLKENLKISKLEINCETLSVNPLLIQTLEMDADAFAISQLTREIVEIINNDTLIKQVVRNESEMIGLLIYSLHCLFNIISNSKNNNFENLLQNKYLPCSMRHYNNIECLKENLRVQANHIFQKIDFENISIAYMLRAENDFMKIFDKQTNWKSNALNTIKNMGHLNIIRNKWKSIYNDLNVYSRCKLSK